MSGFTEKNAKAKAAAQAKARQQSAQAKRASQAERESLPVAESPAARAERERAEDQAIINKLDPNNLDRGLVDQLHSTRLRSYLQHQHSLKDFRKFVEEINKPTIDDKVASIYDSGINFLGNALEKAPVGKAINTVKDVMGTIANDHNEKVRNHYNQKLEELDSQIEREAQEPDTGAGRARFMVQCPCGASILHSSMNRHLKSKRHLQNSCP